MKISKKLLSIFLAVSILLSVNICALASSAGRMDGSDTETGETVKGVPALCLLSAVRPLSAMPIAEAPATAVRTVSPGHARSMARHSDTSSVSPVKYRGKVLSAMEVPPAPETADGLQRAVIINGREFALDVHVIDGVEYAKLSELAALLACAAAEI